MLQPQDEAYQTQPLGEEFQIPLSQKRFLALPVEFLAVVYFQAVLTVLPQVQGHPFYRRWGLAKQTAPYIELR